MAKRSPIVKSNVSKEAAKQYAAFLTDIYAVMNKHKLKNILVMCSMNGEFRNCCLTAEGEQEDEVLNFLSDGSNDWLKQRMGN